MGIAARTSDPGLRTSDSRAERRITLLVFAISCAYLFLFRRYTNLEPDEGIVLQGAQRILRGEVLYRDFFSFFTPGSYYFLALLFKIFGNSFLVARTALALMGGVMSLIHYLLARRVCSRGSALAVTGLVTLTSLPYRFLVLHNWDSTLGACLALYCAVRWLETGNWKLATGNCSWAFATGSFASLTFLFEQSKGAGLMLGLGGGLLALAYSKIDNRQSKIGPAAFCFVPSAYWLLAGAAWPFALTLGYFGAQHSLSPMLADWLWPLQHYSTANRVLYGYQNWSESDVRSLFFSGSWFERLVTAVTLSPCFLVPVLPLVAFGLGVYWVRRLWRRKTPEPKSAYYVLVNAALCGLLLSVVMGRADIIHFMYLAPLFYLVLAWAMDGRDIPGSIFRTLRPILNAYVLVAFGLLSAPLLLRALQAPYKLETRRGAVMTSGRDTVIPYVQARVPPGEKILVYPYLPLYYYLTGTSSPTRYDYFQPGMHTLEQSREMVSELAAQRLDGVLLEISFADKIPTSWPGTSLAAIANDPIADYIVQNYRACRVLKSPRNGRFLFVLRKGLPCPQEGSMQ